jgi:hypothetical protein
MNSLETYSPGMHPGAFFAGTELAICGVARVIIAATSILNFAL